MQFDALAWAAFHYPLKHSWTEGEMETMETWLSDRVNGVPGVPGVNGGEPSPILGKSFPEERV